ncbi:MAG: flagellar hook-associated protein FlgL [Clostridiales Family XIII bacterium]|jgi:flagellar hook-associated protein 3 FlgL|nr:flagellar hook-associated protein FlgL [Clostridiales Family XIII bacterium]
MRITNRIVTEKYLRSVNNISTELDRLNSQAVTERKFTKVSEDTPAAVKAFQIRKDLARVEGYQSSIKHAQSTLNNAESSIMKIQELLHDAREKIVQGLNGTQSGEEREIIATHLKELQKQTLQLLNSNAADIYYFGGNSVRQEPFSVSADGKLQYNCKDGDDFRRIALENIVTEDDPATSEDEAALYKELMNAGLFVDIGMGVRSDSASSAVAPDVDRNSVFTYTLPGLEITGAGTVTKEDGTKVSANIYDLLGAIADSFSASDYSYDKANELFGFLFGSDMKQLPNNLRVSNPNNTAYDTSDPDYDPTLDSSQTATFDQAKYSKLMEDYENSVGEHRPGSAQNVQFAITNIGTKTQFLEFISDTMDTRELNATEQQDNTEFEDPAKSIIYYQTQYVAYQAALSMGSQIIPMSIFNYMS